MTELHWPYDYEFVDWEADFRTDGPGDYDIPDDADEEQYRERGWIGTDEAGGDDDPTMGARTEDLDSREPTTDPDAQQDDDEDGDDDGEAETGTMIGEEEDLDETEPTTDPDAQDEEGETETVDLENAEYDELQSLAKEHDIPANQTASDLRDELREADSIETE